MRLQPANISNRALDDRGWRIKFALLREEERRLELDALVSWGTSWETSRGFTWDFGVLSR